MKKSVLILFLLLILPSILAIEITFSKESYQPQETFQATITGNFISLTSKNIQIFKDPKTHEEPVIKGLTRQNNIYYFYAILPRQEGNYTFRIIDTEYLERGQIKTETIIRNLPIILKNTSDLSINPGFVIPNKDFSIKVKILIGNTDLTATFEATGETKELSLIEQVEETLKFSLPKLPSQQSKITINDYEIPVFLIKKINETRKLNIEFIPYIIEGTITAENDYSFKVLIKNSGNENLTDIRLSSDLNTILQPDIIDLLQPGEVVLINLTISVEKIEDQKLLGEIIAESSNNTFFLPVVFEITKNETEVEIIDVIEPSTGLGALSCSQLGSLCTGIQFCSGDTVESLEGPCCIGQCIEQESSSSTYVGIILIIILILIIGYVIWKVRKRRKLKSPEDILKEKSGKYKKRMEGKAVEGRLDSV